MSRWIFRWQFVEIVHRKCDRKINKSKYFRPVISSGPFLFFSPILHNALSSGMPNCQGSTEKAHSWFRWFWGVHFWCWTLCNCLKFQKTMSTNAKSQQKMISKVIFVIMTIETLRLLLWLLIILEICHYYWNFQKITQFQTINTQLVASSLFFIGCTLFIFNFCFETWSPDIAFLVIPVFSCALFINVHNKIIADQ